jgi:CRISPR-associated protein Cas5t
MPVYVVVRGPFARFQVLAAGRYRPTARFLPHSAGYGLVLNLAGIESRRDDRSFRETQVRQDLPDARIAVGAIGGLPLVQVGVQHLHVYPVGPAGKEHAADCFGAKYSISLAKREFLSNFHAAIAVDATDDLLARVRQGVRDGPSKPGFDPGRIFLGDRDFGASHVGLVQTPPEAFWYRPVGRDERIRDLVGATTLSVRIDRRDSSRTVSRLFVPLAESTVEIPDSAWQECGP